MSSSMSGYGGMRAPTGLMSPSGRTGNVIPKGYRQGQLSNWGPEQTQLFQHAISHLGPDSYLSRLAGGDESLFQEMETPALRQFSELQGGLASRFSGMGLGARKSSGFQNTATAAASNFAQDLQSRRQLLQQQAIKELIGLSGDLLNQRPHEQFLIEKQKKKSGWGGIVGAGLGAAGGFLVGGPAGAYTGASLGYGVGSSF